MQPVYMCVVSHERPIKREPCETARGAANKGLEDENHFDASRSYTRHWKLKMEGREDDDDDTVCLDISFFTNDNYQISTFTFGDQVLQLYCLQSASTDFDLTGQLVWPGAILMNGYLSKNPQIIKGSNVIELGSGVGITGILCSRFCQNVVMTDHNDEVLKILKKNIDLHSSSEESQYCSGLSAEKLEWGSSDHISEIIKKYPEGFDMVLGADICFQQASIPLLFNTVKQLLQIRRKGEIKFILGYVSRAKMMDDMVLNEAKKQGMQVEEVAGSRAVVGNLGGVIYEITLL